MPLGEAYYISVAMSSDSKDGIDIDNHIAISTDVNGSFVLMDIDELFCYDEEDSDGYSVEKSKRFKTIEEVIEFLEQYYSSFRNVLITYKKMKKIKLDFKSCFDK